MSFEMRFFCNALGLMLLFIIVSGVMATDLLLTGGNDASIVTSELCSRTDPAMDPVHEVRYGQDVVWQIPPNPKAVLFVAHGRDKTPLSYFDPVPNCRRCYGLPEDRGAILTALERNYAVIMVKSVATWWFPWSVEVWPPPHSLDRTIVISVLREWVTEQSLDQLPMAAFGYSSGGNFSSLLTLDFDFKSLILMCTPGELLAQLNANASFPPTLFLDMPVDKDGFYPPVALARAILAERGVRTEAIDILPRPISPSNFTDKIPCFPLATAERVYQAYKVEGWLDENDYVTMNPMMFDSTAVLLKHQVLPYCNGAAEDPCFLKHVQEEIAVAYAYHAFSSEFNKEIFDWLDNSVFPVDSELAESTWNLNNHHELPQRLNLELFDLSLERDDKQPEMELQPVSQCMLRL